MKSLSKRLLPFIAAGALSFSSEAVVKAQTPVEITRLTGSTGFKSEKDQPRRAESVELKTPAEMIKKNLNVENPMHSRGAIPENPMAVTDTVGDKRAKLSFGAAGLPEVATKLREAVQRNSYQRFSLQSVHTSEEQNQKKEEVEKKNPKVRKSPWSVTAAIEIASKYFGGVVGETFNEKPAPRFMGSFSRKLKNSWEVAVNLWQSFGQGSNQETDAGVTFSKKGWFGSFTRLFVRGGDVLEIKGGKTIQVKDSFTVTPTLAAYTGTAKTSPPGGIVGRVDVNPKKLRLGAGVEFVQNIGIGADNNLFGQGNGHTGMLFYSPGLVKQVGKNGEFYVNTTFSMPIVGRGNTTRGFRNGGVVAGLRTTWK